MMLPTESLEQLVLAQRFWQGCCNSWRHLSTCAGADLPLFKGDAATPFFTSIVLQTPTAYAASVSEGHNCCISSSLACDDGPAQAYSL